MAQFGEGQVCETHTETFRRKLEEWDTKWTALETMFKKIKSGPELEQEFRNLKQLIVGMPTK